MARISECTFEEAIEDCLMPPREVQDSICAFLDRETAKFDALVEKIRRGIELAKEHRSALVSAAVTGKIDVRGETV